MISDHMACTWSSTSRYMQQLHRETHTERLPCLLLQCLSNPPPLTVSRVVHPATVSSRWPRQSEHFRPLSGFTSTSWPASGGQTAAMWRSSPAALRRWAWCWWAARSHTHMHTHTTGAGVGQGSAHRHVSPDVSVAGSWGASGLPGRWAPALGSGLLGFLWS